MRVKLFLRHGHFSPPTECGAIELGAIYFFFYAGLARCRAVLFFCRPSRHRAGPHTHSNSRLRTHTVMDASEEAGPPSAPAFLKVFESVNDWQDQHGLKYEDYHRYAKFCTSRLRRLYRGLKINHGRSKFVRRAVEARGDDPRPQMVHLLRAERAWARAEILRREEGAVEAGSFKHRVSQKLKKAAAHARDLCDLAEVGADEETRREGAAYALACEGRSQMACGDATADALSRLAEAVRALDAISRSSERKGSSWSSLSSFRAKLLPAVRFCERRTGTSAGVPDTIPATEDGAVGMEGVTQSVSWRVAVAASMADVDPRLPALLGEAERAQSAKRGREGAAPPDAHLLKRLRKCADAVRAGVDLGGRAVPREVAAVARGLAADAAESRSRAVLAEVMAEVPVGLARGSGPSVPGGSSRRVQRSVECGVRAASELASLGAELQGLGHDVGGRFGEALIEEAEGKAAEGQAVRDVLLAAGVVSKGWGARGVAVLRALGAEVEAGLALDGVGSARDAHRALRAAALAAAASRDTAASETAPGHRQGPQVPLPMDLLQHERPVFLDTLLPHVGYPNMSKHDAGIAGSVLERVSSLFAWGSGKA